MKVVSFLAISLAFVSAIFAAGAYFRVRATHPAGAAGSGGDLDALRARVSKLEAELSRSREQGVPSSSAAGNDHSAPAGDLADLKKRVENLERRSGPSRPGVGEGARATPNPALVEMQKKRLMDATQPERARAAALGMLRSQNANKADDIVEAGLGLLAAATEPNIKALILRGLRGAENARIIPPVLALLKGDPDEDVRDESARTLGEYQAQAEVKSALEQAAAGDASAKVKRTASTALAAPPRK